MMIMTKIAAVAASLVMGIPVGGVYASADSPSKYLDRLTAASSSSETADDRTPVVSRAVRTAHGVVLNTVVRNANRLEYADETPPEDGVGSDTNVARIDSDSNRARTLAGMTDPESPSTW